MRIIEISGNGKMNMGIDESILEHLSIKKTKPTLRLYNWSPPCVSIGYFQSIKDNVDEKTSKKLGIDIVRRITGGGTIFHDNELTYSFILPQEMVPEDIIESYKLLCNIIAESLRDLGINAKFKPINDIIVENKKISGSAQTRRKGCVLHHGTIIISSDPEKMFSVIKINKEKNRDKVIKDSKKGIANVNDYIKHDAFKILKKAICENTSKKLKTRLYPEDLSSSEINLAQKLSEDKYGSEKWTFMR